MFEAMARPASGDPYIFKFGVPVNQEIAVPRVLVLADAGLNHGRVPQRWNMFLQVGAQLIYRRRRHHTRAIVRIKGLTVAIKSNLESSAFHIRQSVGQAGMSPMQPDRHFRNTKIIRPRRRPYEEDFLPGRKDALPQQRGKDFWQPRAARKNERSG